MRILWARWTVAGLMVVITAGCGTIVRDVVLNSDKVRALLDEPPPDRTVTRTGRVEVRREVEAPVTVLHVWGTPYEMGYQHGKLLAPQVRATIADVMKGGQNFLPKALRKSPFITRKDRESMINGLLDRAWALQAPHTPREDLEEMAGLAAGSGVPLAMIHRLHAIPELTETSCSALLCKDSATRDGHIYQLRILDYGGKFGLEQRPLITVYHPDKSHAYVNIGWIGFIGVISGINDQRVALSEMGFGRPPGETLAGIPMPFLLKNVLRHADTAEEGAAVVRAARRTNSFVYFLGDPRGGAVAMITSSQRCLTYHANERDVLQIDGRTLPQYRDVLYAGHHEERQGQIVSQMQGRFDVPAIQDMAREIAMKSNLHTVIYDLTGGKIWVANRLGETRAADRPYLEFSLKELFAAPLPVADTAPASAFGRN